MTKQVSLDVCGITFYVTVEYEDKSVCDVVDVRIDPYGEKIKCDTEEFFKALEGDLQYALEEEFQSDKDAYYDMMYEAKREADYVLK